MFHFSAPPLEERNSFAENNDHDIIQKVKHLSGYIVALYVNNMLSKSDSCVLKKFTVIHCQVELANA